MDADIKKETFSFDELVIRTKEVFDKNGMPAVITLILEWMDGDLCDSLTGVQTKESLASINVKPCCKTPYFVRSSREPRRIDSTIGKIKFHWMRLKCKNCKESFIPLRQFLNVKLYTSHTLELEKIACETASHQSYRRSAKHMTDIGGNPLGKSKIHTWVQKTDSAHLKLEQKELVTIVADGTGYPRFKTNAQKEDEKKNPKRDADNRPLEQIRVILGIDKHGKTIPMGVFNEEKWNEIGRLVKRANHHPKLKSKPIAELLVSDGELAIERGLGKLAKTQQRCQWHLTYDLKSVMKYQDEANNEETRKVKDQLHEIMRIPLPNEPRDKVKTEEILNLEVSVFNAERQMNALVKDLKEKQYFQTATYVENAKAKLFNVKHRCSPYFKFSTNL
ncbi:MAG: hypothetical protein KA715_02085 [Xanthomonadaceae bacterium]|nr:hypothetical protein [Xanthomonadaceae bacterium]